MYIVKDVLFISSEICFVLLKKHKSRAERMT